MSKQPSILIVGAGAVGSLYGAKLQQAGADVAAVCRSDYDLAKKSGIQVNSYWGDMRLTPTTVYRSCNEVADAPDFLVVALKVLPSIDRAAMIKAAVGPNTSIVLLQNGVEIEPEIAAAFPANEIISGLAFVCCNRIGPGKFHHLDYGKLKLGTYPEGISDKLRQFADLLRSVDVPVDLDDDIIRARWWKLVWNAPFNPISVIGGGITTQQMLGDKPTRELIRHVMTEVCELAAAHDRELPTTIVEDMIEATAKMEPYKTSMLLDYEANRPMEVEAILGNAVRAADEKKLAIPHIRTLYALLGQLDHKSQS